MFIQITSKSKIKHKFRNVKDLYRNMPMPIYILTDLGVMSEKVFECWIVATGLYLSMYLSIYLYVYICLYLSIYLSPSIYLYLYISIYLSIFIYLYSIYLSISIIFRYNPYTYSHSRFWQC